MSFWLCPFLLWLMRKLFSFLTIFFIGLQYFHPKMYFRFSSTESFFDIFGPITKRKFSEELKPQWIEYIMQYAVIYNLISCGNGVATETKNVPKSSGFSRLDRFQVGSFNVFYFFSHCFSHGNEWLRKTLWKDELNYIKNILKFISY